jgi:hypothetical protein
MGFEPMNTGFADQRVSHFATDAHVRRACQSSTRVTVQSLYAAYLGCAAVRR